MTRVKGFEACSKNFHRYLADVTDAHAGDAIPNVPTFLCFVR